jgi:hypothetical protein
MPRGCTHPASASLRRKIYILLQIFNLKSSWHGSENAIKQLMEMLNIKRLLNPGFVSEYNVIIWSYIAIAALFPLDVIDGAEISLYILYVFPILLIALHSAWKNLVVGAVILSVIFQVLTITLYDDLSLFSQVTVIFIIVISDSMAAYMARVLRESLLEKQAIIDGLKQAAH